jgi:hypothetical protein
MRRTTGWVSPTIPDFDAAGTLFTNGTHVLAGYQKDLTKPTVSGIGGKREGSETYMQTAIRETVEELFHIDSVSAILIRRIILAVEPTRVEKTGSYVLVIYNFKDLEKILEIVRNEIKISPVYKVLPKTVSDLMLERILAVEPRAEVTHLCLVPLVKDARMDLSFQEDLELVVRNVLK